jgi:hypothetical protein
MMSNELLKEIARLKAENAALLSKDKRPLSMKVSQKGALSVYGMGRFPVTLYREQWERLLNSADSIKSFIESNPTLKTKGEENDSTSKE